MTESSNQALVSGFPNNISLNGNRQAGGGAQAKHYQTMDDDITKVKQTADPKWSKNAIFRNIGSRDRSSESSSNNDQSPHRPTKKTVFRHD